jgi:Fur family ferric uptake transcriptional regulator
MPTKRTTEQRKIIEQICLSNQHPLTIDSILQQGHAQLPTLNRVTVYRNLNRMVEEGTLVRLSHPDKGTLYEKADRPHHHHFFCRICEKAFELPGCGLSEKKQAPTGFIVEGHEVFLHGLCVNCT